MAVTFVVTTVAVKKKSDTYFYVELKFDTTVAHREVVKSKGSCRVVLK